MIFAGAAAIAVFTHFDAASRDAGEITVASESVRLVDQTTDLPAPLPPGLPLPPLPPGVVLPPNVPNEVCRFKYGQGPLLTRLTRWRTGLIVSTRFAGHSQK